MDIGKAVETYITKMVSEPSAMKVLLLDTHTVRVLYPVSHWILTVTFYIDSYCVSGVHTVNAALASSIPDGPDRQQETGSHGSYEMCLLLAAE